MIDATRFNPTTNGMLHLGHLYMILLNAETAKNLHRKFVFRFDDNQRYWRDKIGIDKTAEICNSMLEDLDWMGICPDSIVYQSKIEDEVFRDLEKMMRTKSAILMGQYYADEVPATLKDFQYYPYTPYYTLEKVWMDFTEGVNLLIRGEDLITEFALYEYFVDMLGLPRVAHHYVPRLRAPEKDIANVAKISSISKTEGGYKLHQLRRLGISPKDIRKILSASCLEDESYGFILGNIKDRPILETRLLGELLGQHASGV